MKIVVRTTLLFMIIITVSLVGFSNHLNAAPNQGMSVLIDEWEITWDDDVDPNRSWEELTADHEWHMANRGHQTPGRVGDDSNLWLRLKIPVVASNSFAILVDGIIGKHITVYFDQQLVYGQTLQKNYIGSKVLIPLSASDKERDLLIQFDNFDQADLIKRGIVVGDTQELLALYVRGDLLDIVLGSTFVSISIIMWSLTVFLSREHRHTWISLCIIILCAGVLVITYSPVLRAFFIELSVLYSLLFDLALYTAIPMLIIFFQSIFTPGKFRFITQIRNFQIGYSIICFSLSVIYLFGDGQYSGVIYRVSLFLSVTIFGYFMIGYFILFMVLSLYYAYKNNKEAIILSVGFGVFTTMALIDLFGFLVFSNYEFQFWKWGVVGFVISLIIILGRRFSINHERLVQYSKELELFNNELQRSEKMDVISELAASVAHEVRNPLQVTRGFLQLLTEKYSSQDKVYMTLAIGELDRASSIITDFLTFAKPEVGKVTRLNVLDEFQHVEGILIPMSNLQGGKIFLTVPPHLFIKGNSSKFKQAFINIIKNSIEALGEDGEIKIWAYKDNGEIVIHIHDNGHGMEASELARLGEPYFSNKTKGTGLGLMVTFRIIEAMEGKLEYKSALGEGTEAIIRFPSWD